VRIDDTQEVLTKRLASYRQLTEPLIHYYSERRKLLTVDGMMTVEHVTREISRILTAIGAVDARTSKKAAAAKRTAKGAKTGAKRAAGRMSQLVGKGARASKKAGKPVSRGAKKPSRKAPAGSKARVAGQARKVAKKVTKKRAKA
jgi:adenylate kinase